MLHSRLSGGGRSSALSTKIELIARHLIGGMTSLESVPPDNDVKASPYHRDLTVAMESERRIDSSLQEQGPALRSYLQQLPLGALIHLHKAAMKLGNLRAKKGLFYLNLFIMS